jgi:protein arginine N-methyltransferase 3
MQTILLIDHAKEQPKPLKKGQTFTGKVGYQRKQNGYRGLDINVEWNGGENASGKQQWALQ